MSMSMCWPACVTTGLRFVCGGEGGRAVGDGWEGGEHWVTGRGGEGGVEGADVQRMAYICMSVLRNHMCSCTPKHSSQTLN